MNFVKDLLVMSFKQKAEQVNWKELGANAAYLPLVYFAVMAPGFFALLGFCCLLASGVSTFTLGDAFPTLFFLVLGGSLVSCGVLLVLGYRLVLNSYLQTLESEDPKTPSVSSPSHLDQVLAPFVRQLRLEQQLFSSLDP